MFDNCLKKWISLYIIRCKINDYEQYYGKIISAIIQYLSTSMVWQILQFRNTFFIYAQMMNIY